MFHITTLKPVPIVHLYLMTSVRQMLVRKIAGDETTGLFNPKIAFLTSVHAIDSDEALKT